MRKKHFFAFISSLLIGINAYSIDQINEVYQIGNANDLAEFAVMVNNGSTTINAQLTADIDFSNNTEMIGTGNGNGAAINPFKGVFDGQGHKITLGYKTNITHSALFRFVESATIENLYVDGTVESNQVHLSSVAGHVSGTTTFNNVISATTQISTMNTYSGISGFAGIINDGIATFNNCAFTGVLEGENACQVGGLVGWRMDYATAIFNNCYVTATFHCGTELSSVFSANGGNINNCYFLNPNGKAQGTQMTEEQFARGEVCYLLNGDQSAFCWYQKIGEDLYPSLNKSRSIVYATSIRCDGKVADDTSYSNDPSAAGTASAHSYEGYTCTVCGYVNPEYCPKTNDFYQISNVEQLEWFAAMVNTGNTTINAQLAADIDFSNSSVMIGTGNGNRNAINPFRGVFDGQGHTITLGYNTTITHTALFHYIDGATIENLRVDGTVESDQVHLAPVAGHLTGINTFNNVISAATVISTINGATGDGGFLGIITSGSATLNNCAFIGSINGENGCQFGGFAGWLVGDACSIVINNSFMTATFNGNTDNSKTFAATSEGYVSIRNSYYLNPIGKEEGIQTTPEQLASGEICYLMNGDQTTINWHQSIGEDLYPSLDASKATVYGTAVQCDGKPLEGCEFTNNIASTSSIPPHDYVNGICSVCGAVEQGLCEEIDGYYQIGSPEQLAWFAYMVNDGNTTINAQLTDDIDFSNNSEMIGTGSGNGSPLNPFRGIFDGQGHTITLGYNTNVTHSALFHYVENATIQNLYVDGTVESDQVHLAPIAGYVGGTTTFNNVISAATVISTMGTYSGVSGFAGIINDGIATFNNCAFIGAVEAEFACQIGGLVGWFMNEVIALNINNSYVSATFNCGSTNSGVILANDIKRQYSVNNCYYLNPLGTLHGTQMTSEQLANGELCYLLNNMDIESPTWFQNIGTDMLPVPDSSHGVVIPLSDGEYISVLDDAGLLGFRDQFASQELEMLNEQAATTSIATEYENTINTFKEIEDRAELLATFKTVLKERENFLVNANAYNTYIALANDINKYITENEVLGNDAEKLKSYLTEEVEPGDVFPKGSYLYILNTTELTTNEVYAETDYLNSLYENMLQHDYQKDADITKLLINPDFSEGSSGWDGTTAFTFHLDLPLVECRNKTCDIYQNLTELKNGVYELDMNAFFNPAGINDGKFYTSYLYLNDQIVPIMNAQEDCMTIENEEALENFESYDDVNYVPVNVNGAAYAFNAGKYLNRVLVNVTDGTLKVGIRAEGTGNENDLLVFGNTKLYYRGELNQSADVIKDVLGAMANRANSLLSDISLSEYNVYPNFSADLRSRLQAAVDKTKTDMQVEEAYDMYSTFKELFVEIQDCQKAYIELMKKMDNCLAQASDAKDCNVISNERFTEIQNELDKISIAYIEGSFTAEEARAWDLNVVNYPGETEGDYYLIANAQELATFAYFVNNGSTNINAKLTADIDFSNNSEMIGTGTGNNAAINPFRGIFDGQGHTITLGYKTNITHTALFRFIDGATIENLYVDGTVESDQVHLASLAGHLAGTNTFNNVISAVNVICTINGATGVSGFAGNMVSGTTTFNNCAFVGSINGENGNQFGGLVGWMMNRNCTAIFNNSYISATFNGHTDNSKTFAATGEGNVQINNSYYLNPIGKEEGIQTTTEQLASGEICYLLNGDQSTINWHQTIGEDLCPSLNKSRSIVYATSVRCDGKVADDTSYSNDPSAAGTASAHSYEGYTCTVCGYVNPEYCPKTNDFYQISNVEQLEWFAAMVNSGNTAINAKLIADIDFSNNSEMIGTGTGNNAAINPFRGIFDGQGHTITLGYKTNITHTALFRFIDGATIENLYVDGTVESDQVHLAPLAGHLSGTNTFNNVISAVNVICTINGATGDSGFAGNMVSGATTFNNCAFVGSINGENGNQFGGLVGWMMNRNCTAIFNNSYISATFNGHTDNSKTFAATGEGNVQINNSYYLNPIGKEEGIQTTTEQLASGEICYLLNGDQSTINWYQTIGEDLYPVLDANHGRVLKNEDGTYTTGVESLTEDKEVSTSIFNLMGQKVGKSQKGIYIINGKKTLVN